MTERHESSTELEWTEEFFYYGNASWPTGATYRTAGDRIQLQAEMVLETTPMKGSSGIAEVAEVEQFLEEHSDWEVKIHDEYEVKGLLIPRTVYLLGWRELTTTEEREAYYQDRQEGRRI